MLHPILSADDLQRALSLRDLTDPTAGPHAMQRLVADVVATLSTAWGSAAVVHRASPLVDVTDNYDRLHYPPGGAARDARYTRYVTERTVLRTQTSAIIPSLLRIVARAEPRDVLLACPGLVYRRDAIDRLHTGEPHQLDLWRIRRGAPLGCADLLAMIASVVATLLPGAEHRVTPASHPYTINGLQIDVRVGDAWIEIGECGLALPALLAECGLDTTHVSGLAMGLGLDRVLMLRKGVDDIRLLRSRDPRVEKQMQNLEHYTHVSKQPAAQRDLSIAVDEGVNGDDLGDRIRCALGERAVCVEEVGILSETPHDELPPPAIARLGLRPGQKNVLLRVILRHPERSIGVDEGNELRDRIYAAVHEGTVHVWACGNRVVA
jgi:phenylalanyl-tRNA synthetase alpha chain